MTKLNYILILFILTGLIVQNCEEKMPALQSDKPFVDPEIINILASHITGETKNIEPSLESDDHLIMGKNDEVIAYSVIKFMDFTILPDTIDEVLDLTFNFYPANKLPVDTNSTNTNWIKISKMIPADGFDWNEEETNSTNFSIDDISKEHVVDVYIGEKDTCDSVLPHDLVEFWNDSTNARGGFILEASEDNGDIFQSIYSRDASKRPNIFVRYVVDDDTTTKTIYPSDDVSLINYYTENTSSDRLYINEGMEQCVLLNVDLENVLSDPDSNTYVARGTLTFHIDKNQTNNYNDRMFLYLGLIDSTEWYDECLENVDYESVSTIGKDDSVAVFDIDETIQNYITGKKDNVGIIIWSANASHDISNLSLYGANCNEENFKPQIKLLFIKENE